MKSRWASVVVSSGILQNGCLCEEIKAVLTNVLASCSSRAKRRASECAVDGGGSGLKCQDKTKIFNRREMLMVKVDISDLVDSF